MDLRWTREERLNKLSEHLRETSLQARSIEAFVSCRTVSILEVSSRDLSAI